MSPASISRRHANKPLKKVVVSALLQRDCLAFFLPLGDLPLAEVFKTGLLADSFSLPTIPFLPFFSLDVEAALALPLAALP